MEPITATSRVVDTSQYAKTRIQQIAQLYEVVDNSELGPGEVTSGPRTVLQRLPRHMRRRAMSHNVKRLPRSTRAFAAQYLALSKHRKKAPSRLWRRRPANLAKAYLRRSAKCRWLPTHVWHAKRFRMEVKWNYKVAVASFQRGSRPCYRDSVHRVVAHDESYIQCVQLSTQDRDALVHRLSAAHDPSTSPSFAFAEALRGNSEGCTLLFAPATDSSRDLVAPVRFSWAVDSTRHHLNIWAHPAAYDCVMQLLKRLCGCQASGQHELDTDTKEVASTSGNAEDEGTKVNVSEMRGRYVRFQLMGPASLFLLSRVLQPVAVQESSCDSYPAAVQDGIDYWNQYAHSARPSDFRDGTIISLLVEDPRLYRASKGASFDLPPSAEVPQPPRPPSCFWDASFLESQAKLRWSSAEFSKIQSEKVGAVKSTPFKVPIMLVVRNAKNASTPAANRVDVIAPSVVGQDLWRALVFGGARAVGLNDHRVLNFESSLLSFPDDVPDCRAGQDANKEEAEKLEQKMKRRPANRRTPYKKLRVLFPFSFAWQQLSNDWTLPSGSTPMPISILRDRRALVHVDRWLCKKATLPTEVLDRYGHCLVPIRLECSHRGHPKRLALICLPNAEDSLGRGAAKLAEISSPQRQQSEEQETKLREEHALNGSDTHSEFVAVGNSSKETIVSLNEMFPDEELVKATKKRLRKAKQRERVKRMRTSAQDAGTIQPVEQPSDEPEYRNSCSRTIIGRVVSGRYSLATGKGIALGYCVLRSLAAVQSGMVLVRNASSRIYHPAKISLLSDRLDI